MGRSRLDWETLVSDHASILGVRAKLTGEGIGKYERVCVSCDHNSYTIMACRFIQKKFCCRSQARIHQPGRENVGERISNSLIGRKDSFETRIKKAEGTRKQIALSKSFEPNLLYVGSRDSLIKIGRCSEYSAQRWFEEINLHVLEAWHLPKFAAGALELKVHSEFGHLRLLDPSFGKGWTEVFDVSPQLIISFIENELHSDHEIL